MFLNNSNISNVAKHWVSLGNKLAAFSSTVPPLLTLTESDEKPANEIVEAAKKYYFASKGAEKAATELSKFIKALGVGNGHFVTYVDEAHTLNKRFWAFLRLQSFQDVNMKMWVVFMGTKSSVKYYTPSTGDSAGLGPELSITANEVQTLKHLATYGRPLWHSLMSAVNDKQSIMWTAIAKLLHGRYFQPQNPDQVLSLFSQLFCVDLALSNAEAIKMADRSVADHMRLLTGFTKRHETFYTESPSEPFLAVAAFNVLYNPLYSLKSKSSEIANHLCDAMTTFSAKICESGIVEKGLFGELAARVLLLTARHHAAPKNLTDQHVKNIPDILAPISVMDFLDTILADGWAGQVREDYEDKFANGHINFTHWIQTDDHLPMKPDSKLLANLWARGGALQCCFLQASMDFLIPIYHGNLNESFNPKLFSGVQGQVKFRDNYDKIAERNIRPLGIPRPTTPRDLNKPMPLPYLALLMELGTDSKDSQANTPIHARVFPDVTQDDYKRFLTNLEIAQTGLKNATTQVAQSAAKKVLKRAQQDVDNVERLAISVYGATSKAYKILETAGIAKEFHVFLNVVTSARHAAEQHAVMKPLRSLDPKSNYNQWMVTYKSSSAAMDVD
ncbi:hypothetical protein BD410DRAFT_886367 [Rickenella mellea]|uniref:Uncharacterized protein n=1 Tax=Rickenella mellea TaxID=50990 RepID=A0A4Y7PN94_9AGAM|nr:hypothetical protein BD410DRAFT_886367 [Rickenella mellea]